jgi:predicted PurR-regulated permease PerM
VTVRPKRISDLWTLVPLLASVIAIAALFLGREVLIPFALALLLSFVLTPPVTWLEKLRLGRIASVLIVLTLAFSMAGEVLWIGATQLSDMVSRLPHYQEKYPTQSRIDA